MRTCETHEQGDYFDGSWICSYCFQRLSERPTRYAMTTTHDNTRTRQDIVWRASIASADGIQFSKFLSWMVAYLRMRAMWSINKHDATNQCLSALIDMGEPFGSKHCSWDKSAAKEIVTESILSYWDESPTGSNS